MEIQPQLLLRNQMAYNPIANGIAQYFAFFNGIYEMYPSI
jgi:hypothetical protein